MANLTMCSFADVGIRLRNLKDTRLTRSFSANLAYMARVC